MGGVGKRQRETQFIGMTDAEVRSVAENERVPTDLRRKAQRELKYRGIRNTQKRQR